MNRRPTDHRLAERLRKELQGEVLFDAFSRGRYSTDASHYQIEPVGVVVPRTDDDVRAAIAIAREEGVPLLPRGGATSQSGQTVGRALVVDFSKHLNRLISADPEARTCVVEPGIVLDELNRQLRATGLWFPVDVSTASRATIGGMAGNNSCGTRSIRYGIMRDNVIAIDAILADGSEARFGEVGHNLAPSGFPPPLAPPRRRRGLRHDGEDLSSKGDRNALEIFRDMLALGRREAEHIAQAFPEVSRRVGGYLIDALVPGDKPVNLATLLCGSEGTLAVSRRLELKLSPLPRSKALGICHFATFRKAMEATQHIVKLGPVAVEVVDRTLIELARDIAMFRPVMETYVRGKPDALLLVEFAEDDQAENLRRLDRLDELMGDLGQAGSVVKVADAAGQRAVWEVRASGLNIMMSMKSEGKPVSFIEDCAVPLEHLADYTERLTAIFAKHGTKGTWYAHASVGCLHVRPVLNLKLEKDANTMRAIAEEAFALVKAYKGSHSGEHGDGLVRSEFHERMYGAKTVRLFEEVKDRFDPTGLMNPGKIVRAAPMNDRALFRYKPDYRVPEMRMALDWSAYPGAGGGFQGAVEMCNNNGECRKHTAGVMCPSFRVTGNERDVTRGRANALRLAMSGQLGADAFASEAMLETMKLCVSCKGCRRECPTGVDMAKMKIEVLAAANARRGLSLHDRLVAYLPRYAPYAARLAPLMNARNAIPALAALTERVTGFSAKRQLPRWRRDVFRANGAAGSYLPSSPWRGGVGGGGQRRGTTPARVPPTPNPSPSGEGDPLRLGNSRGRAVCRYVQHLLRAGEPARCCRGAEPARLSRHCAANGGREAAAVLRAHVPVGRSCRGGARRGPASACRCSPIPGKRHPYRRSGALLPADLARRVHRHVAGRGDGASGLASLPLRGVPGTRGDRGAHRPADRQAPRQSRAAWPLPPEGIRSHGRGRRGVGTDRGARGRKRGVRAAAAWPAPSAMGPTPTRPRWPWASSACCQPCAGPPLTPQLPPTASPAATRSATVPAARPCTSPASCGKR